MGKSKAYVSMSKGWALGSKEFKEALLQGEQVAEETRAWESGGAREVRESRWQRELDRLLAKLPAEARRDARKSAPWKVKLARQMKDATDVRNNWLARQLDMGSGVYVSKHVGRLRRAEVKGKA